MGTRFYDVSIDSFHYLSESRLDRKALIVFTDGADHYGVHTFEQALGAAALQDYPIYVFGYVGDDPRTWSDAGRNEIRSQLEQLGLIRSATNFLLDKYLYLKGPAWTK